ncbi:BspA family leucine-rich repeat surface protein [Campylobacter devanensis]|uniref:BspA family leucine-rich repeat surface protein n=1 Tax=Campylobacter devanensis TaxID=3161138 RepID=UPI000A33A099|nr:BspA family leucine-rich repeat surface protein [Campylobacter sp. P0098]
MLVVLVWIIALVLAIPTYGISIVVAIFINIALAKVANSALTTASVLANKNIPIDVKIQQLYLNYCQTVHHKTFYSWQYNRDLLLEALGYAMKRLDGDKILSFDVVYAYQKSKGLNSGDRIDYDFLDFIILDIKRMMKFYPKNKAELEKLIENQEINLGDIDTSAITDMSELFAWSKRKDFSGIESWDVSSVTDMSDMFYNCYNFNQPLNNWDVSNVTYMRAMFYECADFNQPLDNWNVSNVTDMSGMFAGCENFNQPLDNWLINNPNADKIINEIYGYGTFEKARATIKPINGKYHPKYKWQLKLLTLDNSVNLGDIDISAITDMSGLFAWGKREDFSGIESWDVSSVTDMSYMFDGCENFNQPLENWDVSSVTDMSDMFRGCDNFNQPLNNWDVSNVTNMNSMFNGCKNFNQPLSNWDVSNVTNMRSMFYECGISDENKSKFIEYDDVDDEIPF